MRAWIPIVLGAGAATGAGVLLYQHAKWQERSSRTLVPAAALPPQSDTILALNKSDSNGSLPPAEKRRFRWQPWASFALGGAIGAGGLALLGERRAPYLVASGIGGASGMLGAVLYAGESASAAVGKAFGDPTPPAKWPLLLAFGGAGVMWSTVGLSLYTRGRRRSNPSRRKGAAAAKRELEVFAARTRLAALRRELAELRGESRAAIARSKETCASEREALKQARADLSARCRAEREEARARVRRGRTKLQVEREIQRAERQERRRAPAPARSRRSELEARQESDQAVERDIPPELVSVWRRVKRQIHAGPHRSRTEAFLEWVEAHPDEIATIEAESAEREAEQMWQEYQATG